MSQSYRNVSPLGALEIPVLGIVVPAGEPFEVPDDLVPYFDAQPGNFRPAKPPLPPDAVAALKGKALDAALVDAGLSVKGTAPEKRQALTDHLAADHSGNGDDDPGGDDSDGGDDDPEGDDGPEGDDDPAAHNEPDTQEA